jgi:hypothetical protein
LGNSSASPKGFVAEELSPIQSLGAAIQCEKCGLANHSVDAVFAGEIFAGEKKFEV